MTKTLRAGFVPLVDAAPLIMAQELGFAAEEGLSLELQSAPSWSTLRDMLVHGQVEVAQMLSPMPVAMALDIGGVATRIDALSVLSVNGTTIGIAPALAAELRAAGHTLGFDDADAAGRALAGLGREFRIGVPFPFSMHAELVHRWLAPGVSQSPGVSVRTVPPPMMAAAIAADEIDAFCVGEPWGSMAVEVGAAELLLPGCAIWAFAPEKVLAARQGWADKEPDLAGRLMRAVWRAGRWLSQPGEVIVAAEILSRSLYLDCPAEVIDRALAGYLVLSPRGGERRVPRFLEFHRHAATFPWRSQAALIGASLARRHGLDPAASAATASKVFRSDLYRRHLANCGADLPSASAKVEGALTEPTAVASQEGRVILAPDTFFDGWIFDPAAIG